MWLLPLSENYGLQQMDVIAQKLHILMKKSSKPVQQFKYLFGLENSGLSGQVWKNYKIIANIWVIILNFKYWNK